ncbi:zinc finger CCCH domain-containing protein [Musa troglodytarum]|uniref:Zinc finger CCCH domain-containing protein n=1 Tax=Musa troglodytarum TaxID=320322 RepID=A0A9E7H0C3_9LILI|nr:zinc finger CCCH domain-containing protein [Musa troglodytarum]
MSTCDGKFCEGSVSVTVTVSFAGPLTRSLDRAGVKRERKGEIEWLAVIPLLVCGEESVSLPPPLRPLDLAATLPGLCATLLRLVPGLFGDRRCRSLRWTSGGNGRSCGDDPVMAGDGWSTRAPARTVTEGPSLSSQPGTDEEAMWKRMRESDSMETGPYPERPGEPDCAYYIRTGLCRFGRTCKFNHPPNRILYYQVCRRTRSMIALMVAGMAVAAARIRGGYPERVGQPECQYYLKTGTCKFGAICKFHHPKEKAGIAGRVQLNILGYPLRPNEKECAYYIRTGECKFGSTCKFHHPQPSNAVVALRGSPVYPAVHSPTTPGQQTYPAEMTNWTLSRSSFIPSPRWQASSSYAQLILPQGVVQVPGWTSYSLGSSPESQRTTGTAQFYGPSQQGGAQGKFPSYRPGSAPMGLYAVPGENIFPERPGQPECQFYMKTGDCKFGAVCKFHHPKERLVPVPNCVLSPLGLPLRPGEPVCVFYSRYGICKFGPNCKFDHPMGTFTYGLSASSATGVPTAWHLLGSSLEPPTLAPPPSQGTANGSSGASRRISISESRHTATGNENEEAES